MGYEFLPEVAIADVAFEAWGQSLEELFVAAGDATLNVLIDNPESLEFKEFRPLRLCNEALDMLLFDALQELIFFKDTERLLLRLHQLRIEKADGQWSLLGEGRGERLDPARHHQRADVKAVTLHQFKLQKTEQGWRARIVLDI